jgi:hypothetical protein
VSPTDGEPQLLYLEPDDEITSVIRRLRGADAGRVVLVAPGRSRATSSVVALRLLSRAAAEAGRSVALVADSATRALAGEAGIAAFASVADATSPTPAPAEPIVPARAPIHVVRGAAAARSQPSALPPATDGLDETMAVHLPPPEPSRPRRQRPQRPARPPSRLTAILLAVLLLLAIASGAAALPGATVSITPTSQPVSARVYQVTAPIAGQETGTTDLHQTGTATGTQPELIPAKGSVTFSNWNFVAVEVPQGSSVSVRGDIHFGTDQRIVVPPASLNGKEIVPSQASVAVTAIVAGLAGNVAAGAIDTIDSRTLQAYLRGGFQNNKNRLVTNPDATAGGDETTHTVVLQSDVDAVVTAIQAQLAAQLNDLLRGSGTDRVYAAPGAAEVPTITIPEGLVGKQDTATFELVGTLAYDRAWARKADVETAARNRLGTDPAAVPAGMAIVDGSVTIQIGSASVSGAELTVQVTVSGVAATRIDEGSVRSAVAGMTPAEAEAALSGLGKVHIDLWPGWVDRLPKLGFRISVQTVPPNGG